MEILPLSKLCGGHKDPDWDCLSWKRGGFGDTTFWPFSKDGEFMKERECDFSHKQIVIKQGVTISN